MGLRPAKCYRRLERPYTRFAQTVHAKNFIGGIPGLKIRQFHMGNPGKSFHYCFNVVVDGYAQIRDNSIEACRASMNRILGESVGRENYWMRILAFPHHILRENKVAQGNHADRISDGMSHCFGTPVGRAIQTRPGTELFAIYTDKKFLDSAKEAYRKTKAKIGVKTSYLVRETTDLEREIMARTKKKIIEEKVEVAPVKEAAPEAEAKAEGEAGKPGEKAEAKPEAGKKEEKVPAKKEEAKGKK